MFGFSNQIVQEDLERIYLSNISWDIFNGRSEEHTSELQSQR